MSAKIVMILCMALFSVCFSMPASKVEAPKENMKTAETIYTSDIAAAPSLLLADPDPLVYRSAVVPSYHAGMAAIDPFDTYVPFM